MKKLQILKIVMFIFFISALIGMLGFTNVYFDIKSTIVDKTCLSCIGMDPVTKIEWVKASNLPGFVEDNLTKGPVFIGYRSTVCAACDDMEPILKDIFNVDFGIKELYYDVINYDKSNINFFHINLDVEKSGKFFDSFRVFDKDNRRSVPMFVIITLIKQNEKIQPYFLTAYGKLGLKDDTSAQKEFFISKMIQPAINYYNENYEMYYNI